jgi:hypothetical protein
MGLHNPNDPRYHQKDGNLFNTYLGKSTAPDPPARGRRRLPTVRPSPPPPPRDAIEDLVTFFQVQASVADANRFLRLVAKRKRVSLRPEKKPWDAIRGFSREHLTPAEVERYLGELRQRKADGQPLIRASPG